MSEVLRIIAVMVAEKKQARRAPEHILRRELMDRCDEVGIKPPAMDRELAVLAQGYRILEHRTINDTAYTVSGL